MSSMLSSPITWVRNKISNYIIRPLNRAADAMGKFVFSKKQYREEQWDLSKVQISTEVKDFIDARIKTSELFTILYENTSRYDIYKQKDINKQKDLFINMIVNAIEQKYLAHIDLTLTRKIKKYWPPVK